MDWHAGEVMVHLTGKVFRFGHMGTQANEALMERALDALRKSL